MPLSRREFLWSTAASAVWWPEIARAQSPPGEPARAFRHGVASGDPLADRVMLWTRVTPPAGGSSPVDVRWRIARDAALEQIVGQGSVRTAAERDFTVKVDAGGLEPGRAYFFAFDTGGERSPVGQTRTLPAGPVDRVRLASICCSNYPAGFFNVYRCLANREDLDAVVHLGDYIYERTFGENQVRRHEGAEVTTLDGYRARYTTYRRDPDLQAAHHAAPWVVTWDDHEVANNYADDVPEDDQPRDAFLLRRAAAYQAFYEFMPLRRSSMPAGPAMGIYRRLAFGRLLEMSVLDTRQYRSDQPCGDGTKPSCPGHVSPERSILGADQRAWLFGGLGASEARWNVLAQQVMVARLRGVRDDGEDTWSMDKWDGYPVERRALLDVLADAAVPNAVVLTGDIHSNWVADLRRDFESEASETVATELVGTSISSGGDGADMTAGGARVLAANPHIKFYNGQRGYLRATVTPDRWTTEFRVVSVVSRPGGEVRTRATFVVENGRAGAQEA